MDRRTGGALTGRSDEPTAIRERWAFTDALWSTDLANDGRRPAGLWSRMDWTTRQVVGSLVDDHNEESHENTGAGQ